MSIVDKAEMFATAAHKAVLQVRKYTSEPYIVHPRAVAQWVRLAGGTDEMIAAAWLHDVVEDTGVELNDIHENFGALVASYVYCLTEVKNTGISREERKIQTRKRMEFAPNEVKTIKLADVIANAETIRDHDPVFAVKYLEEQRQLVEVLSKGGSQYLAEIAKEIVSE